jgi:drug/metabolite transporter (DMT)-like permease
MARFPFSPRLRVFLQAMLVTFLWSTSWILIKFGLQDLPPLTFAGFRYFGAFLCLFVWLLLSGRRLSVRKLSPGMRWRLVALGVVFYVFTQGAQFVALVYLPAMTTSLVLSFTPVVVGFLGMIWLAERLRCRQWIGVVLYLIGAGVYIYPVVLPEHQFVGMAVALVCLAANALAALLGRDINRRGELDPLTVTFWSMGSGAVLLLLTGLCSQGWPATTGRHWLIIGWLAVINTAFAFTLWNHTLRFLSAVESSIINNTMLFQIAVLAWLFLDEPLGIKTLVGILVAGAGILLVQLQPRAGKRPAAG